MIFVFLAFGEPLSLLAASLKRIPLTGNFQDGLILSETASVIDEGVKEGIGQFQLDLSDGQKTKLQGNGVIPVDLYCHQRLEVLDGQQLSDSESPRGCKRVEIRYEGGRTFPVTVHFRRNSKDEAQANDFFDDMFVSSYALLDGRVLQGLSHRVVYRGRYYQTVREYLAKVVAAAAKDPSSKFWGVKYWATADTLNGVGPLVQYMVPEADFLKWYSVVASPVTGSPDPSQIAAAYQLRIPLNYLSAAGTDKVYVNRGNVKDGSTMPVKDAYKGPFKQVMELRGEYHKDLMPIWSATKGKFNFETGFSCSALVPTSYFRQQLDLLPEGLDSGMKDYTIANRWNRERAVQKIASLGWDAEAVLTDLESAYGWRDFAGTPPEVVEAVARTRMDPTWRKSAPLAVVFMPASAAEGTHSHIGILWELSKTHRIVIGQAKNVPQFLTTLRNSATRNGACDLLALSGHGTAFSTPSFSKYDAQVFEALPGLLRSDATVVSTGCFNGDFLDEGRGDDVNVLSKLASALPGRRVVGAKIKNSGTCITYRPDAASLDRYAVWFFGSQPFSVPAGLAPQVPTLPVVQQTVVSGSSSIEAISKSDASLSKLQFGGLLNPSFSPDIYYYTVNKSNFSNWESVNLVVKNPGVVVKANGKALTMVSSEFERQAYAFNTPSWDGFRGLSGLPLVVGVNTVKFEVTAADGVTKKTYTVDVERAAAETIASNAPDLIAPVLKVPANMTVSAGSASGAAVQFSASATDNVTASPTISYSKASGTVFPIGVTTVTVSATDVAKNVASGTFTVTVVDAADRVAPVLKVPANMTVSAGSASGAAVQFSASATDNVTASPTISYSKASGTVFPIGVTTVTVSATDVAKNVASGTFTVTVVDATDRVAPVLKVPANMTVSAGSASGAAVQFSASATDNVTASPTLSYSKASGTVFPIGVTTVTVSAIDAAKNVATGTFTVTVVDTARTVPASSVPANANSVAAPNSVAGTGSVNTSSVIVSDSTATPRNGIYQGLLVSTGSPKNTDKIARVTLNVARTGAVSGSLEQGGVTYRYSGKLNNGSYSKSLVLPGKSTISLSIDFVSLQEAFSANVDGGSLGASQGLLKLSTVNANSIRTPQAGRYNLVVKNVKEETVSYATVTVTPTGAVTLAGKSRDSSFLSCSAYLVQKDEAAIYMLPQIANGGDLRQICGSVRLDAADSLSLGQISRLGVIAQWDDTRWKGSQTGTSVSVEPLVGLGNFYRVPGAGISVLGEKAKETLLTITVGSPAASTPVLNKELSLNRNGLFKLAGVNPESLMLTTNTATGRVNGRFKNSTTGDTCLIEGIVLQGMDTIEGIWLGSNASGAWKMAPTKSK